MKKSVASCSESEVSKSRMEVCLHVSGHPVARSSRLGEHSLEFVIDCEGYRHFFLAELAFILPAREKGSRGF
jgi:hypothetical protein